MASKEKKKWEQNRHIQYKTDIFPFNDHVPIRKRTIPFVSFIVCACVCTCVCVWVNRRVDECANWFASDFVTAATGIIFAM